MLGWLNIRYSSWMPCTMPWFVIFKILCYPQRIENRYICFISFSIIKFYIIRNNSWWLWWWCDINIYRLKYCLYHLYFIRSLQSWVIWLWGYVAMVCQSMSGHEDSIYRWCFFHGRQNNLCAVYEWRSSSEYHDLV